MRYNEYNEDGSDESGQKEIEDFFEEKDEQERYLDMVQAGLDIKYVNQRNLKLALQILEKSFLWSFYPTRYKLKKIQETFEYLTNLIN